MKNGDSIFKRVIIVAVVVSLLVVGFYIFQFAKEPLSLDNGTWGQFGDYIGGTLNPVFGFLSLVVLLLVYIQNKEELEDTRKVLAEQSETLKIQRFEQTFFSLLSLYREITSNLHIKLLALPGIENNKDGKAAIEHLNYLMRMRVTIGLAHGQMKANYDSIESLNRLYIDFNRDNERYFMHYVKTIHRILEFLDGADIKNKQIYANLLKDQFSQAEVQFLFYNSICTVDEGNTLGMLIKYNIFEDINKNHLVDKEIDLQIFEELKQNIK